MNKNGIVVQWEVTEDCNKNCVHCYNAWRDENSYIGKCTKFDHEGADDIVNQIINSDLVKTVSISGGEPLLVFDDLYPYLKKMREDGLYISINTNLMAMTLRKAEMLKEIGIDTFLCSFPASNPELDYKITGNPSSFAKTIEGIKICVSLGMKVTCNMVVTQLNYDDIWETAKLAKELGAAKFSVNRAMQPANCSDFSQYRVDLEKFQKIPYLVKRIKDELHIKVTSAESYPLCFIEDDKLLTEIGFDRSCGAGRTSCVIASNGNIRPCGLIAETYGKDLKKAWEMMSHYRDGSMIPEDCKQCAMAEKCAGGCKAERLYAKGNFTALDDYANLKYIKDKKMESNYVNHVNTDSKYAFSGTSFITVENGINYLCIEGRKPLAIVDAFLPFITAYLKESFTLDDMCNKLFSNQEIGFWQQNSAAKALLQMMYTGYIRKVG